MPRNLFLILGIVLAIIIIIACFFILGHKTDRIGDIKANLDKYMGKECTVEGYVTKTIDVPFTSDDYFKISDSTGEIWISTDRGIPPINIKVWVKGVLGTVSVASIEIGHCIKLSEIEYKD